VSPTFLAPIVIVIDPGHGGRDPGARGVDGVWEKDIVLDVARDLAHRLRERLEATVVLTRESDETLSLAQRAALARGHASLFVSLHANTSPQPWMHGIQTFYTAAGPYSPDSRRLARLVHHRVLSAINGSYGPVRDGGVRPRRLAVLRHAGAPALLFEAAYLSNPADRRRLSDSSYRDATVAGLADGIFDFLSGVPGPGDVFALPAWEIPAKDHHAASDPAPPQAR